MNKWKWGPTGSAGFELATGYTSLRDTSNLDLVIDAPQKNNFLEAKDLLHQLDAFNIRIDIQVETRRGAFYCGNELIKGQKQWFCEPKLDLFLSAILGTETDFE
ncbi:phosphoribosyl-dephospho-CoA transferase MdcG domain-containing protein [Neobacillus vireti]|uniref:phosphoribosyl-dephospho-CoA transferase MdcG domain-containing protein n=1 Tax=Neobacillus vireti TaxID=220686 RepID=UPI002FFDB016